MRDNRHDDEYDHADDAGICGSCGERIEDCDELQGKGQR
jgi:hypothetical protein